MTSYKVINAEKFNNLEVDTDGLIHRGTDSKGKCLGFKGDIVIDRGNGWNTISGEHGANDYSEDFGFILIAE